jgi:hypothetical protein
MNPTNKYATEAERLAALKRASRKYKEKLKVRRAAYRKAHPYKSKLPGYRKAYDRTIPGKAGQLLNNAKSRCKRSGLPCSITRPWVEAGLVAGCALTGLQFEFNGTKGSRSPSIDRIDNSKGYTPENSRLILNCLNMFKGTGTDADMLEVASALLTQDVCGGSQ